MTASATAPANGTNMLRMAGIMILIAGITTPAYIALFQYALSMKAPPDIYVYGPGIVVGLIAGAIGFVAGGAFLVAYILLFAWSPGFGRQLLFLAPALGGILHLGSFAIASDAVLVVFGVVLSLLMILAGFYVWQQRIFLPLGSFIFLMTMIVAQIPAVVGLIDPADLGLSSLLQYVAAAAYIVCGLAMMRGARDRAMLIQEGLLLR